MSDPATQARPIRKQWSRRALPTLAMVLAGLVGAWLGLLVAGTTEATVGPLGVDAAITPAWGGETVVEVDPIGTLVIDSHNAPLRVHVAVRTVDIAGVRTIVASPAELAALDDRLVADLRDVLRKAAARAGLVAIAGAVIVGGLLLRSVRRGLIAGAIAAASVAGAYGLAALTYDPEATREPRFTGLLRSAPQLVGSAEAIASNFDAYADQLASIVTNVGRLYDTTLALPTFAPDDETIRLLHVSDLHLNPSSWELIDAVAEQYDVDAIIDTGDIADHGTAPESAYVRPITRLERPYVFVKGNHDSVLTEAAVAEAPNAIVLNGEPVEVAGLRLLGAPDPRFTPDQSTRGTADEDIRVASEELADRARSLSVPVDIVIFHDPTHAERFDGAAPLVLAGHAHERQTVVLDEGTRIMVQGSTGGAGLRALEGEEPTPVTLSVLYLDPDSKELVAWDDITLGGLGLTSAEIQRHQADEDNGENGENGPTPSPSPSLSPTTSPPP
ncbi:MAG TPA: metallophosphoesterase [Jiangellaceae bacterium]|nr:metallophosphoesterase [Jiangellaceae bacterium]